MKKVYVDGKYINLSDAQLAELAEIQNADAPACESAKEDRVQQLVSGLSTATTIAQIRAVAKAIMDETGGESE